MKNKYNIDQKVWIVENHDEIIIVRELVIKSVKINKNTLTEYGFDDFVHTRQELYVYPNEEQALEVAKKLAKKFYDRNMAGLEKRETPYFHRLK